jgi:hypothetical protein
MNKMNITKATIAEIIGNKLPKSALTFCTINGSAWFVNRKGKMMSRPFSKIQIAKLKQANLLGSLGWSLT